MTTQIREGELGIVYLLHFERPYKHAKHYIGITKDLERRLEQHRRGHGGSKLMKAVKEAGIDFYLARTWEGTRETERSKTRTAGTKWCPICLGKEVDHALKTYSEAEIDDIPF